MDLSWICVSSHGYGDDVLRDHVLLMFTDNTIVQFLQPRLDGTARLPYTGIYFSCTQFSTYSARLGRDRTSTTEQETTPTPRQLAETSRNAWNILELLFVCFQMLGYSMRRRYTAVIASSREHMYY